MKLRPYRSVDTGVVYSIYLNKYFNINKAFAKYNYESMTLNEDSDLMSGSFNDVIIWAWCLLIISWTSVTINIRVIFSCIKRHTMRLPTRYLSFIGFRIRLYKLNNKKACSSIIAFVQLTRPRYLIFGSRTAINFPSKATHWDIISFSASRCITCDGNIQRNVNITLQGPHTKMNLIWMQTYKSKGLKKNCMWCVVLVYIFHNVGAH